MNQRLMNWKKFFILMTTSQKISTVQNAIDLIVEANNIAPLEAVYFVSMVRILFNHSDILQCAGIHEAFRETEETVWKFWTLMLNN